MRDFFGELEIIDRQDLCLGCDSQGFSYHYISHFGTTDVRIYKQKTLVEPDVPRIRYEVTNLYFSLYNINYKSPNEIV